MQTVSISSHLLESVDIRKVSNADIYCGVKLNVAGFEKDITLQRLGQFNQTIVLLF